MHKVSTVMYYRHVNKYHLRNRITFGQFQYWLQSKVPLYCLITSMCFMLPNKDNCMHLIRAICNISCLWQVSCKTYKDQSASENAWKSLAWIVNWTTEQCSRSGNSFEISMFENWRSMWVVMWTTSNILLAIFSVMTLGITVKYRVRVPSTELSVCVCLSVHAHIYVASILVTKQHWQRLLSAIASDQR